MANLVRRQNSVQRILGSVLAPAASYSITAYSVGGVVTSGSSGTTITLRPGHGFRVGDKYLINPGSANTFSGSDTVSAVTGTTITVAAVTVSAGDVLFNLGADTGTTTPNYDASPLKIYNDPAGAGTAVTNATVTTASDGEYSYWCRASKQWELVRDSSGTVVDYTIADGYNRGGVDAADYGAIGNGTTDDSKSLQAAINAAISGSAGLLTIQAGEYLIGTGLNFTSAFGLRVEGASGYGTATKFKCQTGSYPAFDLTGANDVRLENLWLNGRDAGTPSDIGILIARAASVNCEFISLNNVQVSLTTDATANGSIGTIGIYVMESELGSMRDCRAMADHGIVFTRNNIYSITSQYTTISSSPVSMTGWEMNGTMRVEGGLGPALTFNDCHNIFYRGYLRHLKDANGSDHAITYYSYAIKMVKTALPTRLVTVESNIENYERAVYVDSDVDNCFFRVMISPNSAPVCLFANRTGYCRNTEFRINPGDVTSHDVIDINSGTWTFSGNKIWLFSTQSIDAVNATEAIGNEIIDSHSTDPASRITFGPSVTEAYESNNVQGARSLTTANKIPYVTSNGTIGQLTLLKYQTTSGVEQLQMENTGSATDDGASFLAWATGPNSLNMVQYASSHATLANQAWINAAGTSNVLVLLTGGTERMRIKSTGKINVTIANLPAYANNAAALAGGLVSGDLYRTNADPDTVCVVH